MHSYYYLVIFSIEICQGTPYCATSYRRVLWC